MVHPGPETGPRRDEGFHPQRVSGLGRRVSRALLGAALPAAAAALVVAGARGSVGGLVPWLEAAMATSLVGGVGLQWAFHVATVTGLAGVWAFGLALAVEGFFDLD